MALFSYRTLVTLLSIAALAACAATPSEEDVSPEGAEAALAEGVPDENAALLVKDPRTLMQLEAKGLSFAKLMEGAGPSGKELMASRRYAMVVKAITRDLEQLREQDPTSGVGFDFGHRQFDPTWLASTQSRFELVAVVNRTDRMPVNGCGDWRLVYRLAYTATRSEGRLPMTVNLVFPQKDDGQRCATVAARWLAAKSGTPEALLEGPLKNHEPLTWIDVNLQAVRWPSDQRRALGGQSEYILRTFTNVGQEVVENTPKLDMDDERREELRLWIRDNVAKIDDGTAILPNKFLTNKAISVGPLGLARLANKPFSQLFPEPEKAFAEVAYDTTKQIANPAALMRRLDTMSCQGCHQARAIAGFHMLGDERDNEARLNSLAVARSPHFVEELPWRTRFLQDVAEKKATQPRPFAEHADARGGYGQHCGLGDKGFATWTCGDGLECMDHHGEVVGVCSPTDAPVGDACEVGAVTQNPNAHEDTVLVKRTLTCNAAGVDSRCNPIGQGFPDGLCRTDCNEADTGTIVGKTICGGIPSAKGLTRCLTVDRKPFKECLATTNNPTFLKTCSATDPCRDDYACMRVANGPADVGACMPPYFAFQARVDGHMFDE